MSTPPGGPDPYGQTQPPGQHSPYGQTQPPQGQFGQPQYPYGEQPGSHPVGGPPPKKGMSKGLLAAIVGGLALLLLALCCGGLFLMRSGDSTETTSSSSTATSSTSEPTSSTSPSSTTEPTTSSTTSTSSSATGGGDFAFPGSFDGWSKTDYTPSTGQEGQSVAAYTKGGKGLSIVVAEESGASAADFQALWDNDEKVGDTHCGKLSTAMQCAQDHDGKVFLVTAPNGEDATTAAGYLSAFLDAI